MKKTVCILLMLVFCLSLAACGKNKDDNATKDSASPGSAVTESNASASSSASSASGKSGADSSAAAKSDAGKARDGKAEGGNAESGKNDADNSDAGESGGSGSDSSGSGNGRTLAPGQKYESIEAYLNDPKVKESIDAQTKEVSDGVTMKVYGDAGTLVYEYSYVTHIDEAALASTKSALDSSLAEKEETFMNVIDELKKYVAIESPHVRVVYQNDDGSVITEKTFT